MAILPDCIDTKRQSVRRGLLNAWADGNFESRYAALSNSAELACDDNRSACYCIREYVVGDVDLEILPLFAPSTS